MARLKNLPNKEPYEGFNFRLRQTRADELKAYLGFVCAREEAKLSIQELLGSMVETFMDDDKDFQRYKLTRRAHIDDLPTSDTEA